MLLQKPHKNKVTDKKKKEEEKNLRQTRLKLFYTQISR